MIVISFVLRFCNTVSTYSHANKACCCLFVCLVTEIPVSKTEILATGIKIIPYEHSSPVTGTRIFLTN